MPERDAAGPFDARRAWLHGIVYFSACLCVSWATGVLQALLRGPVLPVGASESFWIATAGSAAVVVVGYTFVWPRGTVTHGRPLSPAAGLWGLAWGLTESQLLLSFVVLISRLGLGRWQTFVASYLVISVWQATWHGLYWDRVVVPPHNIPEWNVRKILLVHNPNLLVSLAHLTLFGAPWVFVALQTYALTASAVAMHFPAYPLRSRRPAAA